MNAMANGANGVRSVGDDFDYKTKLNTCIYDYLLKNEQYEVAKALHKSSLPLHTSKNPSKRQNAGEEGGEDSKDDVDTKKPTDLPYAANVPHMTNENSFLLDWFQLFWEMWWAPQPGRATRYPSAAQYIEHTKV